MMEPLTLATSNIPKLIIRQSAESAALNPLRSNKSLILSVITTLLFFVIALASSNYLSRTNRGYSTKILLFVTGVSTSASIYFLTKQTDTSFVTTEIPTGSEFVVPGQKHYQTINIENFSGTLIGSSNEIGSSPEVNRADRVNSNSDFLSSTSSNSERNPTGRLLTSDEVLVFEPKSFAEIPAAALSIQESKSVVLNLTVMDPDEAQRAVDFIAGSTYVLNGCQKRIGESIFLFTPRDVLTTMPPEMAEELSGKTTALNLETDSKPKLRLLDFNRPEVEELRSGLSE